MDLPGRGQQSLFPRSPTLNKKRLQKSKENPEVIATCHYLRVLGQFFWVQPNQGYYHPVKKRYVRHRNPYTKNGIPDIIWIYKGHFIGLEMKRPKGGVQSQAQLEFEKEVVQAGGTYKVAKGYDEAKTFIDSILGRVTPNAS